MSYGHLVAIWKCRFENSLPLVRSCLKVRRAGGVSVVSRHHQYLGTAEHCGDFVIAESCSLAHLLTETFPVEELFPRIGPGFLSILTAET